MSEVSLCINSPRQRLRTIHVCHRSEETRKGVLVPVRILEATSSMPLDLILLFERPLSLHDPSPGYVCSDSVRPVRVKRLRSSPGRASLSHGSLSFEGL